MLGSVYIVRIKSNQFILAAAAVSLSMLLLLIVFLWEEPTKQAQYIPRDLIRFVRYNLKEAPVFVTVDS
jgi:hypothetical protein